MSSQPPALPALDTQSPPSLASRRSSTSRSPRTPLSLDLSDLPPLITPSPPTNTLLVTHLDDPTIFKPENLQIIRDLINTHATVYTWSPLKSMRRIIASFYSTEDATKIRKTLDGEAIFDCRVRIYFGAETKIDPTEDQHLRAPHSDKLFFISPPPSPPHGWEMRNEEPPNKDVHAEDLANALARLHARDNHAMPPTPEGMDVEPAKEPGFKMRSRSSTLVYHPEHAGDSPALPSITVDDTSASDEEMDISPLEPGRISAQKTSRPPVELMEQ